MKIVYPEMGIDNVLSKCLEDIKIEFTSLSLISFNINYDFTHREYLTNFSIKINELLKEYNNIVEEIDRITNNYSNLMNEIVNDFDINLDFKISKREPII